MPNASPCRCNSPSCKCRRIYRDANGKWRWPGQPAKFAESTECQRLLTPTVVLGHEENDDPAKFWASVSTGVPSVGVVADLRRDGDLLKAKLTDLFPLVLKAVKAKAYRKVSAEIYDDFEDQGERYGLALRRIAFLGGEIPQVKELADLPMPNELGELDDVEIFAVGVHPTKDGPREYTHADLDQIVANFQRLSSCGTAKMSEGAKVLHVFHEVRKPKPKVFKVDGRWYWPKG